MPETSMTADGHGWDRCACSAGACWLCVARTAVNLCNTAADQSNAVIWQLSYVPVLQVC